MTTTFMQNKSENFFQGEILSIPNLSIPGKSGVHPLVSMMSFFSHYPSKKEYDLIINVAPSDSY